MTQTAVDHRMVSDTVVENDRLPARRRGLRALSLVVLFILLSGAVVAARLVGNLVSDQERNLLEERGSEIELVLTSATAAIPASLGKLAVVARLTGSSPTAFAEVAAGELARDPTIVSLGILRDSPEGFVVLAAVGPGLQVGQQVSGEREATLRRALDQKKLFTTSVMTQGPKRSIGLAFGTPEAPEGTVLYRETAVAPTPAASSQTAFSDLDVALYAGPRADPGQLVIKTTPNDRRGPLIRRTVNIGASPWLLTVSAREPLVGALASKAGWVVLLVGVIGASLITAVLEVVARRRDYALAMVHARTAELRTSLVEREAAQIEVLRARDEAKEASRLKSEFLANMSHEIRTPMNGVLGMTQLLLASGLTAEQEEYARTVHRSAESLLAVINDILDFSKIEAGRLALEVIDFDPRVAVEEVADLLADQAHEKGLELATVISPDMPAFVQGDPGRIRQVLLNLAGNAVKFTPSGEVVVRATVTGTDAEQLTLRIDVEDTGVGVPPEVQGRLFTSFSQGDASTTRTYGGTGLGLAICKQLVELMDGEIGVQSVPGRGSCFWFTVRLGASSGSANLPARPMTQTLRGLRVLVVDDNATNRTILDGTLRSWGVRPTVAPGASEALEVLRHADDPYQLAILDFHMPGMDGLELAAAISADPDLRLLPLVLLTSSGLIADRDRARAARVEAFLTKPVRQSALYDCLVRVMGLDPNVDQPLITESSLATPGIGAGPSAHLLVVEDNGVNQQVARRMLEKQGHRVDVVANGAEAVEAVSRIPYGAILMDCQMPVMDGYEATRAIRDLDSEARRTPIIALTAGAMRGDAERCLEAGMDDYVSKPVRWDELATVLRRWIRATDAAVPAVGDGADTLGTDPPPPAPPAAPTRAPAPAPAEVAEVLDPAVVAQMRELDAYAGDGGVSMLVDEYVSQSRRQLGELRGALDRREEVAASRLCHSLKGTSASLGAAQMAGISARLEVAVSSQRFDAAVQLLEQLEAGLPVAQDALQGEFPPRTSQSSGSQPPPN
ncbi:MAG TPA: response regulator [Acidimicrobiales bacterium]|nr:response regulator [Acidimicrobiales bacterium]